jgi:hypothetical protein
MMKKLVSLLLVLAVASVASASVVSLDQVPLEIGPSDTIVIGVVTDTTLLGLDAILEITGPATFVAAMSSIDSAQYGWDPGFPIEPIGLPGKVIEIGGGNFSGNPGPRVGYALLHCDDLGDVVVTLSGGQAHGGSSDINFQVPDFVGRVTIHQVPEPMTVALLGLGGLALLRRRK